MKIIQDEQSATITLVPTDSQEESTVDAICTQLKPDDKLSYGGRSRDAYSDRFFSIHLHAGGQEERRVEVSGNITIHRTVYVGSTELVLRGTTLEEMQIIGRIRDSCFFGSGDLIFVGEVNVDGKRAIVITIKKCKHCGSAMLRLSECEWGICDKCASKCEHTYVRGAVHGGDAGNMGIGNYCDKCGRCKPKAEGDRDMTKLEHHIALDRELGIQVAYVDGPPFTPMQAVKVARVIRGLEKSKRRPLHPG